VVPLLRRLIRTIIAPRGSLNLRAWFRPGLHSGIKPLLRPRFSTRLWT
jgi:hypothetical protein